MIEGGGGGEVEADVRQFKVAEEGVEGPSERVLVAVFSRAIE